jgi:hypothetical protein
MSAYIFAPSIASAVGHSAVLVDEAAAIAEQEAGPYRHVGILGPRPTKPDTPLRPFSFAVPIISANVFGYATPLASNSSLL